MKLVKALAKRNITSVVFDFDGTLSNTFDECFNPGFRHYFQALSAISHTSINIDEAIRDWNNLYLIYRPKFYVDTSVTFMMANHFARKYGLSITKPEVMYAKAQLEKEVYQACPTPMPGATELVSTLYEQKIKLGIITHAKPDWTYFKLKPWSQFFNLKNTYCISVTGPKDAGGWQAGYAKLGFYPATTMVVGDNLEADIKPNLELGINRAVWISGTKTTDLTATNLITIPTIADLLHTLTNL